MFLLTVLFGANDLDEMNVTWLGLSRRLELAHQFLGKYEVHINLEEEAARPVSPASTNPEIYSQFPTDTTARNRVSYLFDHVPHHQQHLLRSYAKSSGDLPAELPASSMLKVSFPARNPERNPSTVYYSVRMERMELPTVGYPDEISVVNVYMLEREEEARETSTSQRTASGVPDWQIRGETAPLSRRSLSQDIDYKTGANFFPPIPARDPSARSKIPDPMLLDPIRGIASSSSRLDGWEDSISHGFQAARSKALPPREDRFTHWMGNLSSHCG
ncbi:hypothetical protein B0H14DRAFT_2566309 [Mycena olivaceomarginata]|nr:hypothetical protein B0H14DRAFT_2566309 [Mycena olivaceomarginata]